MKCNALLDIEVTITHWPYNKIVRTIPANVTRDKIYTATRAFCRETLQQLSGIAGESQQRILSYKLND